MALGLKRGTVELAGHDPEWEVIATQTIEQLWCVFGSVAKDIQHVGSTAIRSIKAKPIIDIAVAVEDFTEVEELAPALEAAGFMRRNWFPNENEQMLFAIGYNVESNDRVTTHYIHIVKNDSNEWNDYINFRDYFNANPCTAKEYEDIKVRLAAENPVDPGREKYLAGKHDFVTAKINEARIWAEFGRKFTKIKSITKGWSKDKKYYIETVDNQKLLLRVTDIAEYDRKEGEYGMLERVYKLGVSTPQPIDFGICDNEKSVYSLSGWLDGEDAETLMPRMTEAEQYNTGLKAGAVLRKIHTLSAPEDAEPWESRFQRKIQTRIDLYNKHNLKSEIGDKIIKYLHNKQDLLNNRQQTFWHGDFNVGNHMILPDGEIAAFDYNYWNLDYGDPWWEFVLIPWGKEPPAHYFTGMINGYFDNNPPSEFFDMLSYYYACDALSALCYSFLGMEECVPEDGKQHMARVTQKKKDMV